MSNLKSASRLELADLSFIITLILVITYSFYVQPLKDILGDESYLDLKIGGYSYDIAVDFFQKIGVHGRDLYFRTTLFDSVWPIAIALTAFLYAKQVFTGIKITVAAFFPIAFAALDIIENIGIFTMLHTYPSTTALQVEVTSFFTILKQLMIPGMSIMIIALPIYAKIKTHRLKS